MLVDTAKQEAIEKLARLDVEIEIIGWEGTGDKTFSYHTGTLTKNSISLICNRIAPLMQGKFPETAMMGLIAQSRGRKANLDDIMTDIKRLWEGQPKKDTHHTSLDEIVSNIPPDKRKRLDKKIDDAIKREQDKPKWYDCPILNRRSGGERRKLIMKDCCIASKYIRLKAGEERTVQGFDLYEECLIFRDRRILKDRRSQ